MDNKSPTYYEYYTNLIENGHGVMVEIKSFRDKILDFVETLPRDCMYKGTSQPSEEPACSYIAIIDNLSPATEEQVKKTLAKIPRYIVAELGQINKLENSNASFDILQIEVKSPRLVDIHRMLKENFDNNYKSNDYNPNIVLGKIKKNTCNEYVGDMRFVGTKLLLESFVYSAGETSNMRWTIPMNEYFVGTAAGYGGGAFAGGAVAPMNWAGTPSSPQTSHRLQSYPAMRKYTYMQGNTVIGSSLYDTITADDLKDPGGKYTAEEIFAGLRYEMKRMEYPDKDVAKPIVLKNLSKNPKYYSDLFMYTDSDN